MLVFCTKKLGNNCGKYRLYLPVFHGRLSQIKMNGPSVTVLFYQAESAAL